MPFILRGVKLIGIDSVRCPIPERDAAWRKLAALLPDGLPVGGTKIVGLSDVPALAEQIVAAVPDRSTPIVCFCAGGNRGSLAAAELLDLGYSNVCSIAGGKRALDAVERPQHGEP